MSPERLNHLLLVEDDPADAEYILALLEHTDERRVTTHVQTLGAAVAALGASLVECVLLDLGLPDGVGLQCVQALRGASAEVPIVVLTGLDDDELALACIRAGAQDYLPKHELRIGPLRRAVRYAIVRVREARATRRADELHARLAAIVEGSSDAIVSCDLDGTITSWNHGAERIFGYAREEVLRQPVTAVLQSGQGSPADVLCLQSAHLGSPQAQELDHVRRDGCEVALSVVASALRNHAGDVIGTSAICRDISELKRRRAELRKRNEQLEERDRQLRALLTRLHAVREEERTRIAREVHDELGQLLTGFKMDLRWIARRVAQSPHSADATAILTRLSDAESLVDTTICAVQRIAVDLRPSALDALGLAAAVRDEARRFQQRTSVQTTVDVDVPRSPQREVATGLFRILQELLSNVARHASASAVAIGLDAHDGALTLRVQDNGVGIREGVELRESSLGLLGVRERAQALGGTALVRRSPVGGTIATVQVPV